MKKAVQLFVFVVLTLAGYASGDDYSVWDDSEQTIPASGINRHNIYNFTR